MRKIKFRGKHDGKWLYGDIVHQHGCTFIFPEEAPDSVDNYSVDPDTIGQFTRLRDKNGKDIFEGDIIRYLDVDDKERISRVEYSSTSVDPLNMLMLYSRFSNNEEFVNEFRIEII